MSCQLSLFSASGLRASESAFSLCASDLRLRPTIGARMRMPFSPRLTLRPNWFHAYMPATCEASRFCAAISRMLPKL